MGGTQSGYWCLPWLGFHKISNQIGKVLLMIWHSEVQFLKNVARPSIKETWQLRNPTLTKKHRCYTDRNKSLGGKSFLWRENKQKPSKLWLTRQYVPWLLVVVIFLCLVQNVRLRLSNTKLTLYGYNLSSRWLRMDNQVVETLLACLIFFSQKIPTWTRGVRGATFTK